MQLHHDARKAFPFGSSRRNPPGDESISVTTAGTGPRRSFVVTLWPYMEQTDLYNGYDLSKSFATSPNDSLIAVPVSTYYCSSDRPGAVGPIAPGVQGALGNYVINSGTAVIRSTDKSGVAGWSDGTDWTNCVPYRSRIHEITDGTSKTLLMAEILIHPNALLGTTAPQDARGVFFQDAGTHMFTTRFTPNSGSDDIFACTSTADLPCSVVGGGNRFNSSIVSRSKHPGGVMVLMCDGSARFMPDAVSLSVWRSLSTRNLGDATGEE